MASSQGSNITGQELFLLHPELRNSIYGYVFADIEDSMVIHLEGGANEKHRMKAKSNKTDGVSSTLSLLLTCKKINNEATGVAYSRLSLSLDTAIPRYGGHRPEDNFNKAKVRMTAMLDTFSKGIRAATFLHVTRMDFRDHWTIMSLLNFSYIGETFSIDPHAPSDGCTTKCQKLAPCKGFLHMALHNIRSITLDFDPKVGAALGRHRRVKDETSWLSLLMQPYLLGRLLKVFSNLEEIVLHCKSGKRQKSYVRNGNIFAGGSGMRLGGYDDL